MKVGSRPISERMRSYSSGFSPWAAISSGVIGRVFEMVIVARLVVEGRIAVSLTYAARQRDRKMSPITGETARFQAGLS
ncbi:hypothetical protein GCM10023069_51660 [Shinella granuli]